MIHSPLDKTNVWFLRLTIKQYEISKNNILFLTKVVSSSAAMTIAAFNLLKQKKNIQKGFTIGKRRERRKKEEGS